MTYIIRAQNQKYSLITTIPISEFLIGTEVLLIIAYEKVRIVNITTEPVELSYLYIVGQFTIEK